MAEGIILGVLFLGLVFLPSILITIIGWKITKRIENDYLRIAARSGILSVSFTPTIYGHAGIMPALWMLFLGTGSDRFTYGLFPIIVISLIGILVAGAIRWNKNRKTNNKVPVNT